MHLFFKIEFLYLYRTRLPLRNNKKQSYYNVNFHNLKPWINFQSPDVVRDSTMKNAHKMLWAKKTFPWLWILLHYFNDKLYVCTPFNNSITDSQFITLHSLTFYPTSTERTLLSSAGTRFNIPVFYLNFFLKKGWTKIRWDSLVNAQHSSLTFRNIGHFLPNSLSSIY